MVPVGQQKGKDWLQEMGGRTKGCLMLGQLCGAVKGAFSLA